MEEKSQYFMIYSWAWPTQYPIFWFNETFFRLISQGGGGGGALGISGCECVAWTMEPLTYTTASSAEFCYPILE